MSEPGFWTDANKSQKKVECLKQLRSGLSLYEEVEKEADEISVLIEMAEEERDENFESELERLLVPLKKKISGLETKTLMDGEFDGGNAILSIHAGAGGTESCDWAQMLLRMYSRWAQAKGYGQRIVDVLPGDEAGIKNVTVIIKGSYVYGHLKAEAGVHRLVRISPFDSQSRRHTSFCSVDVIPEVDEEIELEVNEADLRVETFRASGHGGQHVNVTDSAVRITHLPTRITAQCQNERSQHRNRDMAMKVLRSRLFEHYRKEKMEKFTEERQAKGDIAWGNQIRSYVYHPYTMVKDHRTGVETGNVQSVMDGSIDNFITAYLQKTASDKNS